MAEGKNNDHQKKPHGSGNKDVSREPSVKYKTAGIDEKRIEKVIEQVEKLTPNEQNQVFRIISGLVERNNLLNFGGILQQEGTARKTDEEIDEGIKAGAVRRFKDHI